MENPGSGSKRENRFINSPVSGATYTKQVFDKMKERAEIFTLGTLKNELRKLIDDLDEAGIPVDHLSGELFDLNRIYLKDLSKTENALEGLHRFQQTLEISHLGGGNHHELDERRKILASASNRVKKLMDIISLKSQVISRGDAKSEPRAVENQQTTVKEEKAKIEEIKSQIGNENFKPEKSAKSKKESLRERIVEAILRDGGFSYYSSLEKGIGRTSGGYQEITERLADRLPPGCDMLKILKENGVNESIIFEEDVEPVYEETAIPEVKGFFGRVKEPARIELRPTGQYRPRLHAESVPGGKQENQVSVRYSVDIADQYKEPWRDYSGRAGQIMHFRMALPKSQALELQKILDEDPSLIRCLVEKIVKEKILGPEKSYAWDRPSRSGTDSLKPPYERLDGRIYFQPLSQTSGAWNPKNIRQI